MRGSYVAIATLCIPDDIHSDFPNGRSGRRESTHPLQWLAIATYISLQNKNLTNTFVVVATSILDPEELEQELVQVPVEQSIASKEAS